MTHREPWRVSTKNGLDSFVRHILAHAEYDRGDWKQ